MSAHHQGMLCWWYRSIERRLARPVKVIVQVFKYISSLITNWNQCTAQVIFQEPMTISSIFYICSGYPSALFRLRYRGVPLFTIIRRNIEELQKQVYGRVLRPNSYSFYQPPYPGFGSQPAPIQTYPGLVYPYLPRRKRASSVNQIKM